MALCAVFMFGTLSASAASAEIGGKGVSNQFGAKVLPSATISCATGKYTGTFLGAASAIVEVTPSYTGCKFLNVAATNAACQSIGFPATGNDWFLTTNVTVKGYSDSTHTNQVDLTVP